MFKRGISLLVLLSLLGGCLHLQLNGSVSGADISLTELRPPGSTIDTATSATAADNIANLGQQDWDELGATFQLWWLGIFTLDTGPVEDSKFYLLTASGGFDHDMDRDLAVDGSPTALSTDWRAIMTGEQVSTAGRKITALTEAAYRWVAPEIENLSDAELLQRLDAAAAEVVTDLDGDGSGDYDDLVLWTRLFNAKGSFKRDISLLNAFADGLANGASDAMLDDLAARIMEGSSSDYDAEYWRQLSADLDDRSFATEAYLYASTPDTDFCIPGALSSAARDRARESLNQIRALHELAPVSYSNAYDEDVQEASLLQAASGFLSHFPDTGAPCFTEGGADASATGNLAGASRTQDPAADMIGWVHDSANLSLVAAAGHRRWIINPFLAYTSYGQVDGWAVQKVFDFDQEPAATPSVEVDYVAFPYRSYPYLFFSTNAAQSTPWSFSVIENQDSLFGNQHAYFTNAGIEVLRISDGASMSITDQYTDTSGFGVPNFLSWNVEGWAYDTLYQVTISNVVMQSGQVQDFSYPVFIDYADLVDLSEPLETGDGISGTTISGSLFDGDDEDSYTLQLSGNVTIEGESQFANQAFFILLYGPDEQLVHGADESFSANLAAGEYTVVVSNCFELACYGGGQNYTITFN
jgi:uncharacterized protein YkwD